VTIHKIYKKCDILGIRADLKEVIKRHVIETIEHCTDLDEETLPKRLCVKGCLISDFVSLWLQSPNWVPNHDPELYPHKGKMLRVVIWHPFL
jgi:hypothetical protein